jgi:acetylglutamate kinase
MTIVVKVGGRVQRDANLPQAVATAACAARGGLCLVHGGGDEISAMQRALGVEPVFVAGRRFTTADDVATLRTVLSGTINQRLVAQLRSVRVPALGLSGEVGALIDAIPLDPERLGRVGTPQRVNVALLRLLLGNGFLPVISPVSRDCTSDESMALNVNGDDAAAAIAMALKAEELLLLADVPGLLVDGAVMPVLDEAGAEDAIATGIARDGMAAKLEAALRALSGGVSRVRIGSLAALTDPDAGTVLVPARSFA